MTDTIASEFRTIEIRLSLASVITDRNNVHRVDETNRAEVLDFIMENYWTCENFSRAMNLHKSPEAIQELRPFTNMLIQQGHSLCYMNGCEIAAVALNVLQTTCSTPELYEKYARNCKQPGAAAILNFVVDLEQYDEYIFKQMNIDCYLEIICIATAGKFKGRGCAGVLMQETIELARQLKNKLQTGPGAVVAECTSPIAKKLTEKLGFYTVLDLQPEIAKWKAKCIGELPSETILKLQVFKL